MRKAYSAPRELEWREEMADANLELFTAASPQRMLVARQALYVGGQRTDRRKNGTCFRQLRRMERRRSTRPQRWRTRGQYGPSR